MSNFFRSANTEERLRIETPDGEGYLELRGEFSKEEINKIMRNAPRETGDLDGGFVFMDKFFELAVVDWSWTDDAGNPVKPTVKAYKSLAGAPAQWVDKQLNEHLKRVLDVEELEKKPSS